MSFDKVIVFIRIVGDSQLKIKKLNLDDNLSEIRKELEKKNIVNNLLSFLKKFTKDNDESDEFAEIQYDEEEEYYLKEIVEIDDNSERKILYLKKNSRLFWSDLNEKCNLDYGCTMSFDGIKKANKRSFTMKDCEFNSIGSGYKKGQLEFDSAKDWMKKTNLFFSTKINVQNFVELGMSIGGLKNENFNEEVMLTYQYTEIRKVSLKLSKKNLELTDDFRNDINDAINSKDPRKFKKIIEEYGQFIPTEVILGGRVYFKDVKISSENSKEGSKEGSMNIGIGPSNVKIGGNSSESKRNSKFYSCNYLRILGGKHPDDKDFDEKSWIESLKDHQNWDCIEFKNLTSIFQLLPDDLCKKSFESIGKRILYTNTENYNYYLHEPGRHGTFELRDIPRDVLDIILNENADCDIFAVVVNAEDSKNVFFTCQILKEEQKSKPSIIIHGILQKKKKIHNHAYKLRIKLMIVGYDIYFSNVLSDVRVQLTKQNVHNLENQCKFHNIPLQQLESDLISRNIPFFGIPILRNLDSSNDSLVIGHHFFDAQNESISLCAFSYCLKSNHYVNLPNFTFCTLIISNYPASNASDAYKLVLVKSKKLSIDLKEFNNSNPKYISLCLSGHKPIFLNQKSKQVYIEHVDCHCCNDCDICKIPKNKNIIKCIFFDPNISDN